MKRTVILCLCLLMSVVCFAQRGGGGGGGFGGGGNRGGGGGNRGGGGGRGGAAAWGVAAFNDTIPMTRQGGTMFWDNGRNNAIREDDLKEALGEEQFDAYEKANRLFIKGDYRQSAGVLIYIPAAILGVISFAKADIDPDKSRTMAYIAGGMVVPATAFVIWGANTKKQAKREIDDIASDYNKKVEKKKSDYKAATLGFAPFMNYSSNDLALGAGLRLSF